MKILIERTIRRAIPALLANLDYDELNQNQIHFCFLFEGKRLVCVANNKPVEFSQNRFFSYKEKSGLHAEMACIIKSGKLDLSNYELVVVRYSRQTGLLTMSKPCDGCMSLINKLNLKSVWYSNNKNSFEKV